MLPEIERRTLGTIALRAEGEGEGAKKKKLTGYAALFNVKSQELWGFKEVILPGAFDRALRENHDVRALLNHDPNFILGRTTAKTLDLAVDAKGLKVEIDPPDTSVGRDTVASVERGDLTQMSFAFRTLTDDWRMQDGEMIRELIDLELLDVSVVAYPAYEETGVQVSSRALERAKQQREIVAREMPADANMPKVGDRVRVIRPHMPEHDGAEGTVRQAIGHALGIEFDDMPGDVHQWYLPTEVVVTEAAAAMKESARALERAKQQRSEDAPVAPAQPETPTEEPAAEPAPAAAAPAAEGDAEKDRQADANRNRLKLANS